MTDYILRDIADINHAHWELRDRCFLHVDGANCTLEFRQDDTALRATIGDTITVEGNTVTVARTVEQEGLW